ncbi:MAG: hypothetical protein K1W41_22100 [Lachnospiraceae bacterium]
MEEDTIITELKKLITYEAGIRSNFEEVRKAFDRLNVIVPEQVKNFYYNFAGPFGQRPFGGITLLDITDDNPNIESITQICREEFKFPTQYLVVTDYCDVGDVTILNTLTGELYKVCLECGEDEELLDGKLEPTWKCFNDFLIDFFDIR